MTNQELNGDRLVRMKICFTNYDTSFIQQHLKSYIEKVSRYVPYQKIETPRMKQDHPLLQFAHKDVTRVPAYQLFTINIKMVHSFVPTSRVYFVCALKNAETMFQNCCSLITSLQPEDSKETLLPLATQDGSFPIPSIYPNHKVKPIILFTFALDISLEQMLYALVPYSSWRPVTAKEGKLSFPLEQSIIHTLPSLQHTPPNFLLSQRPQRRDQSRGTRSNGLRGTPRTSRLQNPSGRTSSTSRHEYQASTENGTIEEIAALVRNDGGTQQQLNQGIQEVVITSSTTARPAQGAPRVPQPI